MGLGIAIGLGVGIGGGLAPLTMSAPPAVISQVNFNFIVTGPANTLTFTSNDGSAVLPSNSTLTSGTGTFTASLKTAGTKTLTATDTANAAITATDSIHVGAKIVYDAFTDTDDVTLDSHTPNVAPGGSVWSNATYKISSNEAVAAPGGTVVIDAGVSDGWVICEIDNDQNSDGVAVRSGDSGAYLRISIESDQLKMAYDNGSGGTGSGGVSITGTFSTPYTLYIQLNGSLVSCYAIGEDFTVSTTSAELSIPTAFNQTVTTHGICGGHAETKWLNFAVIG